MSSGFDVTGRARWRAFLTSLLDLPMVDRPAAVGAALSELRRTVPFPPRDRDGATFVYQGNAKDVAMTGDMTGWLYSIPLQRLPGTDIFYLDQQYEPDARLDYKFIVDSEYLLDPWNETRLQGGFGVNSELVMPQYPSHPETQFNPAVPAGRMVDDSLYSLVLRQERPYHVYLPAGYHPSRPYPYVYFQDGSDYLDAGQARFTLDNLIAQQELPPVIGVFVDVPDRSRRAHDYANNPFYVDFFTHELMPRVEGVVVDRILVGDSFGGLACGYLAYRRPDLFGKMLSHSGAFPPAYGEPLNIAGLPPEDRHPWAWDLSHAPFASDIYLVVGTYEHNVAGADFKEISERFTRHLRGNPSVRRVQLYELNQGHSWGLWRDTLGDGLRYLIS